MFRVKSTRRSSGKKSADIAADPLATTNTVTTATATATATTAITATTVANTPASSPLEFFAAESTATALAKPWLRLDRGLRLQRFRAYADAYPGLSPSEKIKLYDVLVAANDKKLLNTKQQVNYDNGLIQSIRGLKVIRTGDAKEPAVIKIEGSRLTKRNTEDV
jgi:hypothetical protein